MSKRGCYLLQWQPWGASLPWEYAFDMASDAMAIEYGKGIAAISLGFRAEALALLVWRVNESEKLLARFVLDKPIPRNTEP